jgi:cytochrome P450
VFAEHPDAWEALAADPELLPTAVDEVLRLRGIVPALTRKAEVPFDRDGLELDEGGRLLVSFTSANQDPSRFPDPTTFAIDRADAHAHLTFGWGPHLCVGAGLARLELAEALRALTARFGPPVVEGVGPSGGFATPDTLHVRFPPRRV